jgi:hypothetical protein
VEADGLTFFAGSTVAEEITKDSEYKGARILMDARMDKVSIDNPAQQRTARPAQWGNFGCRQ